MLLTTNHVARTYLSQPRPVYSWKKIFNQVPLEQKAKAWQQFQNDIRDTTTPEEMARLLVKIQKKQILSAHSTDILLGIMEKCRTGRSRIKGLLPPGIKVAHKTGTWGIDELNYIATQLPRTSSALLVMLASLLCPIIKGILLLLSMLNRKQLVITVVPAL